MFSSIRLLVLISSFAATILSTAATNDETAAASVETILGDMNIAISTTRLMNRASPKCWMASITMSQWGSVSGSVSGASYCASMTTEQQKVLALELTNCQLMEENRSLFVQDQDNGSTQVSKHATCHVGKGGFEPYEVSSCLPFMSDFALNLYHQVLLYTNDVCNRLTYDAMEQQKEETTIMLIKASSSFIDLTRQQQMEADLSQKAREQAMEEAVSRNKLYLQEHQQQWEEVNQARQMEVERVQEARERAAEAREREVEAREKAALLSMEEMVEQNKMHFQEQQQKWEELSSARDTEMLIVEERREQTEAIIKKQQYDMERMQEVRYIVTSFYFFMLQIVLTLCFLSSSGNRKHKLANAATFEHASLREDGHKWLYSVEINFDLLLFYECIMDDYDSSITDQSKTIYVWGFLCRICRRACSCVPCRRYITCRRWSECC